MGLPSRLWAMGIAAVAIGVPQIAVEPAVAQVTQTQRSQAVSLFVDPVRGHDGRGNGSENAPLQTITGALAVAEPNTVIILSPGTYSAASGENFPLRLRSGVTLYGNPNGRGAGVVISGGGLLNTRFGRQNAAILGANGAGLNGVTITNPQGSGVWMASGELWVVNSTLQGNSGDGITIAGSQAPRMQNNRFVSNSGREVRQLSHATTAANGEDVPVLPWGNANAFQLSVRSRPNSFNKPQTAYNPPQSYRPAIPTANRLSLLPVPDPNPPIGNRGDLPLPATEPLSQIAGAPPPPPADSFGDVVLGRLQYRLLVNPRNDYEAALVRLVVPDAFTVRRSDGSITQAGTFRSRDRAEAVLQELRNNGVSAQLEHLQ